MFWTSLIEGMVKELLIFIALNNNIKVGKDQEKSWKWLMQKKKKWVSVHVHIHIFVPMQSTAIKERKYVCLKKEANNVE